MEKVVVGAAGSGVHRALASPEKDPVATVRHGVVRDDVARALLVHEKVGRVLPATVECVAVTAHVVVHPVVHDRVTTRPVQADADSRVERECIVPDAKAAASHEHEVVHPLLHCVAADLAARDVGEIHARPVAEPLVLLIVVE